MFNWKHILPHYILISYDTPFHYFSFIMILILNVSPYFIYSLSTIIWRSLLWFLVLLISLHFLSMCNMASTMPVSCDSPYWHVKPGWLFLFFSISSHSSVGFISFTSIIWVQLHHLWHTIHYSVFSLLISFRATIVSIIFQKFCLQSKCYFPSLILKYYFQLCFFSLQWHLPSLSLPPLLGVLHWGHNFMF